MNPFRIMIVDDSTVFRSQLRIALTGIPGVEVASFATNGRMAIDLLKVQTVDLVVLDLEMPEMDGMETLKEIKRLGIKTKVIVFSAHTKKAADTAISALSLGALDLVTKPAGAAVGESPSDLIRKELRPKIEQFLNPHLPARIATHVVDVPNASAGGSDGASLAAQASGLAAMIAANRASSTAPVKATAREFPKNTNLTHGLWSPKVVVIASSTGGPAALEKFFTLLTPTLRCPVLIVQHMPPVFTAVLAERLGRISGVPVTEAKQGEALLAGHVYVAPGDYHMRVAKGPDGKPSIALDQEPQRNSVRPAADHLFESASQFYGGHCLGVVFTGMGADGAQGAAAIKAGSGTVLIQDRDSCVVYGMPGAVADAGAYDRSLTIEGIAQQLATLQVFAPASKAS